jgi:Zn-dependent peptidase ImmA (M78 family)
MFKGRDQEFAANLLMPAALVRARHQRRWTIDRLAQAFNVSDLAMRYRLANLGLR